MTSLYFCFVIRPAAPPSASKMATAAQPPHFEALLRNLNASVQNQTEQRLFDMISKIPHDQPESSDMLNRLATAALAAYSDVSDNFYALLAGAIYSHPNFQSSSPVAGEYGEPVVP